MLYRRERADPQHVETLLVGVTGIIVGCHSLMRYDQAGLHDFENAQKLPPCALGEREVTL